MNSIFILFGIRDGLKGRFLFPGHLLRNALQSPAFSKTDFATSHAGVDDLGEDVILVIKGVPYSHSKSTEAKERESFTNHFDLLKSMLEYRK